jgi:hypothetical protein
MLGRKPAALRHTDSRPRVFISFMSLRLALRSIWLLSIPLLPSAAQGTVGTPTPSGAVPIAIGHGVIPLNGLWRFHTGDDPRWSAPDFDDSSWDQVDLTPPSGAHDDDVGLRGYVPGWMSRGHPGYLGYAWYRLRVSLSGPPGDSLALTGPLQVDDAYQLFADGQLMGGSGDFSGPVPVVYNTRPAMFPLVASAPLSISANARTITLAVRVWMEPGAGPFAPDAGGMHIAPAVGEMSGIRARHQMEWTEKVLGYIVEIAEPISFLLLAVMAGCLIMFEKANGSYMWLCIGLVLLAMLRANQAFFFWTPCEPAHLFDVVRNVLLVPLLLGAWTMVWRHWFGERERRWASGAVMALTAAYIAAEGLGRSWLSPPLAERAVVGAQYAAGALRLLFAAALLFILYRGISRRKREGWLALPAVLAVSVGLFAQELSALGVRGIWFPFGVGVSRTQFAYAAFDCFMFVELFRRLARFARDARTAASMSRRPLVSAVLLGAFLAAPLTAPLSAQDGAAPTRSVTTSDPGKGAPPPAGVYSGRDRQLSVRIPRMDAGIAIDGTLDNPVWRDAALLTGFSEYTPIDGLPAEDSTQVLVWYSPRAIYFGIRAFEPHGGVHYKLADRDKIDADDNVQIILTPFVRARQALVFAVNPLGIQQDGTMTEGVTTGRRFNTGTTQTGRPTTDLSPDFVYESKGHVTPFGYEIVVRIPFRSIKYQTTDPQDWGINVLRKVQHSGHEQTWVPSRLAASSFLNQSGTLTGLTGLDAGLVLDLNPFVTARALGDGTSGPSWRYDGSRPAVGSNLRWGITNNLTLTGSYRPDFAEVEADATRLILDPRNALSYPEKRPFFLDGLEQFVTPNSLVYTRAIQAPVDAVKLAGKLDHVSVGYLGAQDQELSSVTGTGNSLYNILRLQRDVASGSIVGMTVTDKEQGGAFNRLLGADARFTFNKIYALQVEGAASTTRDSTRLGTSAGPLWYGRFTRAGRNFGFDYLVRGVDPEFVAGSGFISRAGIAVASADHRVTFYAPPGGLVETYGGDFRYSDTWVYRTLTSGGAPEDRRYQFNGTATLHGGWQVGAAVYIETFGYDPTLYKNYYLGVGSGAGTTYMPLPRLDGISNTDLVATLYSPQFAHFSMSVVEVWGRDENFFEWSSADVQLPSITLTWQPTPQIRVNGTLNAQIDWRHSDGSLVARTIIPRLDAEYQLTRSTFVRFVGEYDAAYQDSLRDDSRTNLPIYMRNPTTGAFSRAASTRSNVFQGSLLFSYRPVPGTVAFIGYGNDSSEPDLLRFTGLRRQADNFFVKFSYLFRLE